MLLIVNSKDRIFFDLYERFTGNKPGQTNMVTFTDSNWHSSVLVPKRANGGIFTAKCRQEGSAGLHGAV